MLPPFLICLLPLGYAFSLSFSQNLQKLEFILRFLVYFSTLTGALVEYHALKYILYAPSSQIYLFSPERSTEFQIPIDNCPPYLDV